METVSVQPHLPVLYNVRGSSNSNSNNNNLNMKSSYDVNNSKDTLTLSPDLVNSSSSSRERGKPISKICSVYDVNSSINNNNNNISNINYCSSNINDNGTGEMFESVEVCHRGRRRLVCAAESFEDVFDIYYTLPDGTPLSYRSTVCMDQHILSRIRDDLRRVAKKLDNPESAMPERGIIFIEDIARAVTENDQLRYTVEPELIQSICLPVLNGQCKVNYSNNNNNNNNNNISHVNASNVTVNNVSSNNNINNVSSDRAIPRSSTSPDTAVRHRKHLHKNKNGNSNSSSLPNRSLSPATSVTNTSRSSQVNLSRRPSKTVRNLNGVNISSMSSGVPYGLSNFVAMTHTVKDVVEENPSRASLERSQTNGLSLSNGNNQKSNNNSKEVVARKTEHKHKNTKKQKTPELDNIDEFIRQEQARSREFATAV